MAYDFSPLKNKIAETYEHFGSELAKIRTGRATPALLDSVRVDAYGTRTPLAQLASLSIEDARTIRIIAWDKDLTRPIEKAVVSADLGVSVSVDDQGLRVAFPELTAERRTLLNKLVGEKLEQAKIAIRAHRTETIRTLEAQEKERGIGKDELFRLKEELQKIIDTAMEELEEKAEKKRVEIAQ